MDIFVDKNFIKFILYVFQNITQLSEYLLCKYSTLLQKIY